MSLKESSNLVNIESEEISIGKNFRMHPTAFIRGISGKAKRIVVGDNVYIGEQVQIIVDELFLGDYSKIHHHTNIHGYKPCKIGHNAWIGQYTIIDSIGGVSIGNNCGIGAHSQLWSHIKYGDQLEGCNFLSEKSLEIGNDVWLVGHCIVSPVVIEDKAMALVGSVITERMTFNSIYAGVPAKNISGKLGPQFNEVPLEKKYKQLNEILDNWRHPKDLIRIVMDTKMVDFKDEYSYFDVSVRKYKKMLNKQEISFMNYLLPEKAKFTPF
ncbi:hypothetical protein [uncultured Imperialibacter sp.]|uniref:acyltransferase n=1 Tax=uncultured Imperialibacter sp. TaxID=1672639 RepID=UPI0030D8C50B|tara:strand:+ start:305 stop:1111 length:807 start_codon:yes stop_codon:yes gene_type:complete